MIYNKWTLTVLSRSICAFDVFEFGNFEQNDKRHENIKIKNVSNNVEKWHIYFIYKKNIDKKWLL